MPTRRSIANFLLTLAVLFNGMAVNASPVSVAADQNIEAAEDNQNKSADQSVRSPCHDKAEITPLKLAKTNQEQIDCCGKLVCDCGCAHIGSMAFLPLRFVLFSISPTDIEGETIAPNLNVTELAEIRPPIS